MDPWIFVKLQNGAKPEAGDRYGLGESIMLEYKRAFDVWQDGGVKVKRTTEMIASPKRRTMDGSTCSVRERMASAEHRRI